MKCSGCSNDIEESSKFCGFCGYKVPEQRAPALDKRFTKRRTKNILFGAVLFAIGILAIFILIPVIKGYKEDKLWKVTSRENSITSYEFFVKQFPTSRHYSLAFSKIIELKSKSDWEETKKINTINSYSKYLDKYCTDSLPYFCQNAKTKLDSLFQMYPFKVKKIGDQIWMTENLNANKFRSGDIIKQARTKEEWQEAAIKAKAAWCYYSFDENNEFKYAKLYNWYAVKDSRDLSPEGFHISTEKEWKSLIRFLGGPNKTTINKMIALDGWKYNNANNSSRLSLEYSGRVQFDGSFYSNGGAWWLGKSGYYIGTNGLGFSGYIFDSRVKRRKGFLLGTHGKMISEGYSIRCVKD